MTDLTRFTHLRGFEVWGNCSKCGKFCSRPDSFLGGFKKYVMRKQLPVIWSDKMHCDRCWREINAV